MNPAAVLMRVWSEEVYGTHFVKAYDFGPTGNRIYIGSLFEGPHKSVAAFMSAGTTDGQIELKVTSGDRLKVVSPFGVMSSIPVTDGRAVLPVSELPVYVRSAKGQSIEAVPPDWGANLAQLPGVVVATSMSSKDPVERMVNGELENWYYAQGDSPGPWSGGEKIVFPAWVEIKLPSVRSIDRVIVFTAPPWQAQATLVDYELQYEEDGRWVTIERIQEPTKTFKVYTPPVRCTVDSFFSDRWVFLHHFKPVSAQRIRLLIHQSTYGGGATKEINTAGGQAWGEPRVTLREIELYGPANGQYGAVLQISSLLLRSSASRFVLALTVPCFESRASDFVLGFGWWAR